MRCHYEVLGVPITASVDEIKKAYRKAALLWHPDKHGDSPNKEEINKKFLEVQDAYETLSSDQERAWYDAHREVLINGGTPGDPSDAAYLFNVYPYFSSGCFQGFGDDERGFYSVYRGVFAEIAEEDRNHYESETNIPEFGDSSSDYDTVVGPFYSFWSSYCTPRSFVWMEKHDTREAGDRYVRRVMEKENKKMRDKAKKERNEEIRRLVEFVRKKDKRVELYKKALEERAQLAQQKAKEKKEADRLRRQEQMKNYVEPQWSTVDHMLDQLDLEEEKKRRNNKKKQVTREEEEDEEEDSGNSDEQPSLERGDNLDDELEDSTSKDQDNEVGAAGGGDGNDLDYDDDDDDDEDGLFCVACNKSFKSAKSFQNHEKSKKHKENVEILKKHMNEEDLAMFSPSTNMTKEENSEQEQDDGATRQKLSKKQKKKRRQNKNLNESSDNEDAQSPAQDDSQVEAVVAGGESVVDETPTEKVPASEKPAARSVKKGAQSSETAETKSTNCSVCGQEFDTRNKLFEHITQEGHAAPKLDGPMSHNALKKNKRMAKAQKK